MKFTGNPRTLKEVNSSTIERYIFSHGPVTKPELSKLTRLSLPTVNKIVDSLEVKGFVCPAGYSASGAGRKAVLYQTNKNAGCVIVLYYSWGRYLCRLADIVGNTLYEISWSLDNKTAESAAASTFDAIDSMLVRTSLKLKAIGVGIPGAIMPDGKIFAIPKISVWEGFNLREALAERYNVPINVENDVKLAAVGCYRNFPEAGLDNIVYIYAGNGMGSGIIINKKLYRGSTNFSGEFGFLAALEGERPACDYTLDGGYLEKRLNPFIKHSEKAGDKDILINFFTAIAANYIAIINPAAIVFGGEAFSESLIDEIRVRVASYSPPRSIPRIIYDDNNSRGIAGLVFACIGEVKTEVQIVQNGGV